MPNARLERTRRAYDRVIDMGPYGCKLLMVGEPDHATLNAVWTRVTGELKPESQRTGDELI